MSENFGAAKQSLNELIQTDVSSEIKGYALNNLGMAYWWDYQSKGSTANTPEETEAKNTIPTLKQAIMNIEHDQNADRQSDLKRFLDTPKDLPDDYKDLVTQTGNKFV